MFSIPQKREFGQLSCQNGGSDTCDGSEIKRPRLVENPAASKPLVPKRNSCRRVNFAPEPQLEDVKIFLAADKPTDLTLTPDQVCSVQEIIDHDSQVGGYGLSANATKRMQFLKQHIDDYRKREADSLQPVIRYCGHAGLRVLVVAEENEAVRQEKRLQQARESTVFSYHDGLAANNPGEVTDPLDSGAYAHDVSSVVDLEECFIRLQKERELNRYLQEIEAIVKEQKQAKISALTENPHISFVSVRLTHQTNLERLRELISKAIHDIKTELAQTPQLIHVDNKRTVPCKNYHNGQGCPRGLNCNFIHVPAYERQPLPYEIFSNVRERNMRENTLDAIRRTQPVVAQRLIDGNAQLPQLQAFIQQWNAGVQQQQIVQVMKQQQAQQQQQQVLQCQQSGGMTDTQKVVLIEGELKKQLLILSQQLMAFQAQGNHEKLVEVQKAMLLVETQRQAVVRELGQRMQVNMIAQLQAQATYAKHN